MKTFSEMGLIAKGYKTVIQFAEAHEVCPQHLRKLIRLGKIKGYSVKKEIYFNPADAKKWYGRDESYIMDLHSK